ncbi:MAG: 50S ribosomal protein L11 [Pseudomonadota bacterium]
MAKKIAGYVKLEIPAGGASPQPPIGPALGQRGINIMGFCKEFNAKTTGPAYEKGMPVPVVITYYVDKSFSFETKTAPVSYFLKKAAGITAGHKTTGRGFIGKVKESDLVKIAEQKMKDLNCDTVDSAVAQIRGSARSMGLEVV